MRNLRVGLGFFLLLLGMLLFAIPQFAFAEEPLEKKAKKSEMKAAEKSQTDAYRLNEMLVTAPEMGLVFSPSGTTVNVEEYLQAGTSQNILDILKDMSIFDFRGYSDLIHENDDVYMRGFDSRNFVMSWDGLSMGKTEGQGGNFVDFSTVPLSQIESIEILPGPHSALFSGRAVGGVINVKQKPPQKYETLKPNFRAITSFRTYDTQTHRINIDGGVESFVYGFSYENFHTDGFLRHNEEDSETVFGSLGYLLPADGYVNFSLSYMKREIESPEKNDLSRSDYDSNYPAYENGSNPGSAAAREDHSHIYRLHLQQPTGIGKWTLAASHAHESRISRYDNGAVLTGRPSPRSWETYAANLKDEFTLFNDHQITIGTDYQEQKALEKSQKENESYAAFIQDKWSIAPGLVFTGGLRYEYWNIWFANKVGNLYYNESDGAYLERNYNQLVPKAFLTYALDKLSESLRDTSVSIGVSKIWSPTSYCPHCSWGSGYELDPVHGVGYDLVLMRRLWKDIVVKVDCSHYIMNDYVISASDSDYINEGGWGRRRLNLDEVIQDGVEVRIEGHLFDPLSFYVDYTYQDWTYHGPDKTPYGEAAESLDDRAKHRVTAGLKYRPFKNTLLIFDYKYQDEQVALACEEEPEGSDNWVCVDNPMDAYHLFDFAVEQTLLKNKWFVQDAVLKFYVNNLFDEEYENSRGYPMTDRTYGVSLRFAL